MSLEYVTVEVETDGEWVTAGSVSRCEPPASLSSEVPGHRDVYLAGWIGQEGPGVWISTGGFDAANDAVRVVHTIGLRQVARLCEGPASVELTRQPDVSLHVRFVYHPTETQRK